jgi:hypothetical protein
MTALQKMKKKLFLRRVKRTIDLKKEHIHIIFTQSHQKAESITGFSANYW